MDRGPWQATCHEVTKELDVTEHAHTRTHAALNHVVLPDPLRKKNKHESIVNIPNLWVTVIVSNVSPRPLKLLIPTRLFIIITVKLYPPKIQMVTSWPLEPKDACLFGNRVIVDAIS